MKKTLLLNSTYEPLSVIDWHRAVVLDFLGKIETIKFYEDLEFKTCIGAFKIPSIIKLKNYVRYKKSMFQKFCKKNVFSRDNYQCQYCGKYKKYDDLTYDHIIPKSIGGKTIWKNIVTCCKACNQWKGDNTPEQAGMRLLKEPVIPRQDFELKEKPVDWKQYLEA